MLLDFLGYKYVYQDHRNIANESSVYKITAIDISNEFEINPNSSEKQIFK